MKTLILGGVKSGKSNLAESMAVSAGKGVVLVATALPDDDEMRARIARHRQSRPADWQVIEESLAVASELDQQGDDSVVIVDCLTLWLTNCLMRPLAVEMERERELLVQAVLTCAASVILVSNETSMGVVPLGELTRRYCDEAGLLHQQLAAVCDNVILTVAGLPHYLKGSADL